MEKLELLYLRGFLLVLFAGFIWSFGVVLVRHMEDSIQYQYQYLVYRGIGMAILLVLYLAWREGQSFYKNLFKLGWSGILGGFSLAFSIMFYVLSITQTSVAVTLFMLASGPFLAAALGFYILKERLSRSTLIAMLLALVGVSLMAYSDIRIRTGWGVMMGFMAALSFATFTITLRLRKETPQFTTVAFAGIAITIIALGILWFQQQPLAMPTINIYLSLAHGVVFGSGLILFSMGAKYLPAAELALLSLMEVVCGIIWSAIPLFGIEEIPTLTTIIGGVIISGAVLIHGQAQRTGKTR